MLYVFLYYNMSHQHHTSFDVSIFSISILRSDDSVQMRDKF